MNSNYNDLNKSISPQEENDKCPVVKSLKKALDILEYFTDSNPEWGISDLSRETGLYKSNIFNILYTLEASGYIEKNIDNGKYRLGLKFLDKSHVVLSCSTNFDIIHKTLTELSHSIPEIIYYGILNKKSVMYMDAVIPASNYVLRSINGMTAPLYCTGLGKAILSRSDDSLLKSVMLSSPLEKFTQATIVDYEEMRKELFAARERGYAIDNMEHEYGVKCVAVPITDYKGRVNGAISVSGPSLRFTDDIMSQYAKQLQQAALELKNKL